MEKIHLWNIVGTAHKSGEDFNGNQWTEFEADSLAEQLPGKCCICGAELENGWSLQTVFWHTCYEARVECDGDQVVSYNIGVDESTEERPALLTRIDAQLKAEELFEELARDLIRQCFWID